MADALNIALLAPNLYCSCTLLIRSHLDVLHGALTVSQARVRMMRRYSPTSHLALHPEEPGGLVPCAAGLCTAVSTPDLRCMGRRGTQVWLSFLQHGRCMVALQAFQVKAARRSLRLRVACARARKAQKATSVPNSRVVPELSA